MDIPIRTDSVPLDNDGISTNAGCIKFHHAGGERLLWRVVTSATATPKPDEVAAGCSSTSTQSAADQSSVYKFDFNGRQLARARLAEMMQQILNSPSFLQPQDDNPWTGNWCITFPSDLTWQDGIYKKLLERQRLRRLELQEMEEQLQANGDIEMENLPMRRSSDASINKVVLHEWNILPSRIKKVPFHAPEAARLSKSKPTGPGPITWTVDDLANAGALLNTPPLPVTFKDEQEMRRVYTLIYDVFRYKNILTQSLDDVTFFMEHREMRPFASRVWLLLYDLYHRRFKKRTPRDAAKVAELFPFAGLQEVEDVLWIEGVRLAAAIARIRIKNKVLRLSELLPHHLRDEKTLQRIESTPLTCWVNIKKIKTTEDVLQLIQKTLNVTLIDENCTLTNDTFKWDPHCPHFIAFHPSLRHSLVQSKLVKKNKLIVQDKSFCLGPATFVKIVTDLQLTGSVIQSHVNSPRTTAYLASILSQNDNIKKLLAFSAGDRKSEYESYFNTLGIKNILIFEEKMIDVPPDSSSLEEVIAVFATPPNSYSAVADPIDLVCSRGGDLALLEVLTETEDTAQGRKRVANILDEQKKTLKFAMSRPQIQFVLYETHSEIAAENGQMIQRTLREINKCAQIHHAISQGKIKGPLAQRELAMTEKQDFKVEEEDAAIEEKRYRAMQEVIVPESDIFDVSNLPDLCPYSDACLDLAEKGCYLALVQRKQVSRMDNKYMIQMAENRGVFGADPGSPKKSSRVQNKKRSEDQSNSSSNKPKRHLKSFEMGRMLFATKASLAHSKTAQPEDLSCSKMLHIDGNATNRTSQSRRWWEETTRHITNLRATVNKQGLRGVKTSPDGSPSFRADCDGSESSKASQQHAKNFLNRVWVKTAAGKVDEVVANSRRNPHQIPMHPKLRLSRYNNKQEMKVPIPVAVTMVTFPPSRNYW